MSSACLNSLVNSVSAIQPGQALVNGLVGFRTFVQWRASRNNEPAAPHKLCWRARPHLTLAAASLLATVLGSRTLQLGFDQLLGSTLGLGLSGALGLGIGLCWLLPEATDILWNIAEDQTYAGSVHLESANGVTVKFFGAAAKLLWNPSETIVDSIKEFAAMNRRNNNE